MTQNMQKLSLKPTNQDPNNADSTTSRSSSTIKAKLLQMAKTLYNAKLIPDQLSKLEKEALRGEGASVPESRPAAKVLKKPDMLTSILKSEHKASNQGTQIVRLPKLPFGQHKSYNEEPLFKASHFIEQAGADLTSEKLKELEEVTRKFRLFEKKFKGNKKSRLKSAKLVLSASSRFQVYDMGPGELVCDKQEGIMEYYDREKQVFKDVVEKDLAFHFNVDKPSPKEKYLLRKTIDFRKTQELMIRLLPVHEEKESKLSDFYTGKYSTLFQETFNENSRNLGRRLSV
jgi:hypothetical protein